MNALKKIFALSCKEAAILSAKASVSGLSYVEKMKLKMHAKVCGPCQQYSADGQLIDQAIAKILEHRENEKVMLTPEQKEKILKAIS